LAGAVPQDPVLTQSEKMVLILYFPPLHLLVAGAVVLTVQVTLVDLVVVQAVLILPVLLVRLTKVVTAAQDTHLPITALVAVAAVLVAMEARGQVQAVVMAVPV
jgi:hypothetical protein